MIKRFVVRLLIILQVYNTIFQGVAHANLIAHYPVRDEIYLHTSPGKDGSLHIALGTNRRGGSIGGAIDAELLEVISVPSYDFLSKSAKRQGFSTRLVSQRLAPSPSMAMDKEVAADETLVPALSDMPALSLAVDSISAMDAVFDEAVDDTCTPTLFSKSGVTRAPEGVHFTLQGLEIFINNVGEALIQGTQTDFSKPIFLNWGGVVILSDVHAKALQIAAPRIVGIGNSTIEELVLEGSAQDGNSTFVNGGILTAKELFLKNLTSTNNGSISAPHLLVEGQFKSQGSLTSDELLVAEDSVLRLDAAATTTLTKVFLGKGGHLENHATAPTAIEVLHSKGGILTSHGPLMVTEVAADSAFQAIYNRHTLSVDLGDIKVQLLENAGSFTAVTSALQVLAGRNQHGLKAKALVIDEEFINEASAGLLTESVSGTGHLHNLGRVETVGELTVGVKQFTGKKGLIKAKSITGQDTMLTFANLEDSRIEVAEDISFAPTTKVSHKGELIAKALHLVSDHTLQYGELTIQRLILTGVAPFTNHGTISCEHLDAATLLLNHGILTTQQSTKFVQGLRVVEKATAQLKGLRVTGGEVTNFGKLQVVGVAPTQDVSIKLINTGSVIIDAGCALPSSSALISTKPIDPELMCLTLEQMRSIGFYYKSLLEDTNIDQDLLKLDIPIAGHPMMRATRSIHDARALTNQALRLRDLLMKKPVIEHPEVGPAHSVIEVPSELVTLERAVAELIPIQISRGEAALQKISTYQHVPTIKQQVALIKEAYEQLTEAIGTHVLDATFEEALGKIGGYNHAGTIKLQVEVLKTAFAAKASIARGAVAGTIESLSMLDHPELKKTRSVTEARDLGNCTLYLLDRILAAYKQRALISLRVTTLQILEEQLKQATRQELTPQILREKTDQLRVVTERYQVLDTHFKPERALIDEGLGGIVDALMRSGLILEPLRAEHLRKREEYQQLTQEKRVLEQELAANQQLVAQRKRKEAQIAAYKHLSPEIFKVRLSITNQTTGKLTLRSGHFDLRGDQAFVNDGVLIQEAAHLEWADPSAWSTPREWNRGTWRVKGSLTLQGDATKNVGKLLVEHDLHVSTAGVSQLRGQIEVPNFSATSAVEVLGTLVAFKSAHFSQGLTVAKDAVADLKGLKLTGGEIINHGKLKVTGVDHTSTVIKLTNSGIAVIDDQQVLPKLDESSPENLARVATGARPTTWDSSREDHEFVTVTFSQARSYGSKYLRLFQALKGREVYKGSPYPLPEEFSDTSFSTTKSLATRYKREFIKLYESEVAKSQTDGSAAEQEELQQYLKQFEPHYKQVFALREAYAKSCHPAVGSALAVESAQIPAVKLQLLNQTLGQLTLKAGRFEFVGDAGLVNDGTLTQDGAYTLWLTNTPGEFNRGNWRSVGSLGLLGYFDAKFAELQVGGTLYVDSTNDAFKVLEGLTKAEAARVSIKAGVARGMTPELAELYPMLSQKAYETELFKKDMLPKLYAKIGGDCRSSYEKYIQSFGKGYPLDIAIRDAFAQSGDSLENWRSWVEANRGIKFVKLYSETERRTRLTELAEKHKITCSWPLEILINGNDFTNGFNLSAPSLKISSRIFKTSGHIYAHAGSLDLVSEYGTETSDAIIGGRDGAKIRSRTLTVANQKVATGKPGYEPKWQRAELGVYSECGLVDIDVTEKISCRYGEIKGTHFVIKAPELENVAGLICGTTPKLQSALDVKKLIHKRDDAQGSYPTYSCPGHGSPDISEANRYHPDNLMRCGAPYGCRGHANTYETSEEATILANGPLDLTYEALQAVASSILVGGRLIMTVKGAGGVKAQRSIEDQDFSGKAIPAITDTSITGRNGKDSRILAAGDIEAALRRADISSVMHGENVHLKAAMLAMSSLGLAPQQQAQFVDLFLQASGSRALRQIDDGSVDTVVPLTHRTLPDTVVVVGKDAAHLRPGMVLDVQMTGRALHQIMGSQISTIYRGVAGLGLSIPDFLQATLSLVRSHKDTVSQRLLIKTGDKEEEREVLTNSAISREDLLATKLPALFWQFGNALDTLESEQRALDALTTKPKLVARPMLGIPAPDVERAITAKHEVVIDVETILKVATSVKAEIIKLLAGDMATVESTVIHYQVGENSWEVLDRTNVVALKTLLIQSPKIHFKAVNTHSGEESFFIADVIFDEAVATTSVTVTREHSKKETRTTTDVYTRQNTSTHGSDGTTHFTAQGIVLEGAKLVNADVMTQMFEERAVHDTRHVTVDVQKHGRKGFLGFGGSVKKGYHFSSDSSFSRGSENAGRFFKMIGERFKATHPSFTAVRSDITTPSGGSVEILAGANHHQSVEQSSSTGAIWQKVDVTTEKHKVHVNPHFGGAVHIHSPSVIVERVNGSGLFPNLHSDSPVQYRDMEDTHEHHHHSQKSLTAGAALIIKLAATLAMTTLTGNPLAAEGLTGTIASAGLNTLCSEAAVCLVEQGGDPGRAMEVLGERNIGKSMLTAMAGAGLTGALGVSGNIDATGLSTSELITAYAKHEMIKAAVNATLAATIDGQDLGQAMLQGIITAGISTAAAFGAHKIGDLHKPTDGSKPISGATHKALHTGLGAITGGLSGGIASSITGDSFADGMARGAASGGFGALVGTLMTEAMVDDKTPIATAQRITQISDLLTTTLALAAGLDPVSAYAASRNANEHNFLAHHLEYLKSIGMIGDDAEKINEILDDKDSSPAKKAEIRKVLAENPKLARSLIMQKYAQTQLLEASRLERLSGDLSGDTYASRLSFDALDADGLQSTRERAHSLRLSAYRTIAHANDYLNQFAKENPALAHYAVKGLKFAGAVLHAGAYVTAFATGGPVGTATLFAIEQTVSKSLEAAIEVGAEHAAKSASSPVEADSLRQGFYEMAGKGTLLLGAAGIAKVMKGKGTGSVGVKPDAKPKVARDDFYVPQSQTGSRFLEFDARARGMEQIKSQSSLAHLTTERPLTSSFYSTLFKAKLESGMHYPGKRDLIHFQEANKQLYTRMLEDHAFAKQMETLYPGILKSVSPGTRGAFPIKSPQGLTWHHNTYEAGVLELIPRSHHVSKGPVQANLHPEGKGGQQVWGGGR